MTNYIFRPLNTNRPTHYYGDIVRALFMVAAILMLVGLPAVSDYIGIPTTFSIIGILVLGLAAGLTNPKQKWDAAVNTAIAAVAFVIFESYAVSGYRENGVDKFFLSSISLGFVFMVALYFGVKTLRGQLLKE